ncbi:hypothetical protein F5984_19960 [Rudanella paleaurantiibacter]|uniref:Uncharacterized protein n=1 Tax=Rudanella paleaurantiibacter TaxID=2614655 RepID=A0A7J5TV50_9BACT|nr:hypothetical protein [Rudanella paleaurantiibacter]KAB7728032.1 hypothetical protein F5984_19960 [Rudanella paleaurantiibacter]
MTVLQTIGGFLKGAYTKFGTSANLIREVSVSVLTAVAVAVLVQLLTPSEPSPVAQVGDLLKSSMAAQHKADSIEGQLRLWQVQRKVDSLTQVIQDLHEKDSMRANAGLSDLDAIIRINGAIESNRRASTGQNRGGHR